jgi:hypothetical protein
MGKQEVEGEELCEEADVHSPTKDTHMQRKPLLHKRRFEWLMRTETINGTFPSALGWGCSQAFV